MAQAKSQFSSKIRFGSAVIGSTYEKRDLVAHSLTIGPDSTAEKSGKPIVLLNALHHSREPLSLTTIVYILMRILFEI